MKDFFIQIKQDGSLYTLKCIIIGIILFGIIGAGFGLAKVTLFEQFAGGKVSTKMECVRWDNKCLLACHDDQECSSYCCTEYRFIPLGERLKDQASFFALIFGTGPGLVIGVVYGQGKWKKREEGRHG